MHKRIKEITIMRRVLLTVICMIVFVNSIKPQLFSSINNGIEIFYEVNSTKENQATLIYDQSYSKIEIDTLKLDTYVSYGEKKYLVTEIGNSALHSTKVKHIILPDSITKIKNNAFARNHSLVSISLPTSVISIGDGAFSMCIMLRTVSLSDSLKYIGGNAFGGCSNLQAIEIPPGVKKIEGFTFHCCFALKRVILPFGLKEIADNAFYTCSSFKIINLPNTLEIIGNYALERVILTEPVRLDSLKYLGEGAFSYSEIKSFNISKSELVSIPSFAFGGSNLAEIILPIELKTISKAAFADCISLESISFPESLTYIGKFAFVNCIKLGSVHMNNKSMNIDKHAFNNTKWLNDKLIGKTISVDEYYKKHIKSIGYSGVYFDQQRYFLDGEYFYKSKKDSAIYKYFASSESCNKRFVEYTYPVEMNYSTIDTFLIIDNGVRKINKWVYFNSSVLRVVQLPYTVEEIGCYAFARCKNLHTLIIEAREPPSICDYIVDAKNDICVYVPDASLDAYRVHMHWGEMNIKPMSDLLKK